MLATQRLNRFNLAFGIGYDFIRNVSLNYRHIDQAENYVELAMERNGSQWSAHIPAPYTNTMFPLQYYFKVTGDDGSAALHPGFSPELTNQPYFVVRSI